MAAAAFSSGKQRSAKASRLTVLGANLNVKTINVSQHSDELDTTNIEAAGYDTGTVGVTGLDWDFDGDWDAGKNFYDAVPGIYPRDDLGVTRTGAGSSTIIYGNVADNVPTTVPTSRVVSSKNTMPVRGLVGFSATCKSNGQFTMSTGSV